MIGIWWCAVWGKAVWHKRASSKTAHGSSAEQMEGKYALPKLHKMDCEQTAVNQRYPIPHLHPNTNISLETQLEAPAHSDLRLKKKQKKENIWSCQEVFEIWFKQSQADTGFSAFHDWALLQSQSQMETLGKGMGSTGSDPSELKQNKQLAKSAGCDPKYSNQEILDKTPIWGGRKDKKLPVYTCKSIFWFRCDFSPITTARCCTQPCMWSSAAD